MYDLDAMFALRCSGLRVTYLLLRYIYVLFMEYGRDEVKCPNKTYLFGRYVTIVQDSNTYLLSIIYKLK